MQNNTGDIQPEHVWRTENVQRTQAAGTTTDAEARLFLDVPYHLNPSAYKEACGFTISSECFL
jgi:hypothetical protein